MKSFAFLIITLSIFCPSLTPCAGEELDAIEKARLEKLDQARKAYENSFKKIYAESVLKYESLLKRETAAGKLDSAIAIRETIKRLKDAKPWSDIDKEGEAGKPAEGKAADDALEILGHDNEVPKGKEGEKKVMKEIERRGKEFGCAMVKEDFEKAFEYIDPDLRNAVAKNVAFGFLKLWAASLQLHGVRSDKDIEVKDVTIGAKRSDARILWQYRGANTDWRPGDPQYWVRKGGKWYIGDDKQLRSFK